MSTLMEIQDAVAQLSGNDRKVLQVWLNSQNELEMTAREEQRLLGSLDTAIRDIDNGNGMPIGDVRRRVASWVVK